MNLLQSITWIYVLPAVSISIMLSFVRLVRGPSLPDRVVALDLMSTLGVGVIAAYSIFTDNPLILDVATVLALISFLGTIAFAYYVEKRV